MPSTPVAKKFLIDTPSVYYDVDMTAPDNPVLTDKFLGLSKGGISLSITPTIREIEFDGKLEKKVKDLQRVTKYDVVCEGSIVEFNRKILETSLLKTGTTTSTKYDLFVPSTDITYKNIVIIGKMHGSSNNIMVVLKNTFNSQGFNFEGKDNDESACKFTFNAHYDTADNLIPVEIYVEKVA